jgi:hypothetical protein
MDEKAADQPVLQIDMSRISVFTMLRLLGKGLAHKDPKKSLWL